MTDTAQAGANPDLFRARAHATDVEARPISARLTPPVQRNPPSPRRYYLYLMAPAITILAFISLYPFFWLIVMSFQNVGVGAGEWTGLRNFTRLIDDDRFINGWILLLQYSAMCLALQLSIGLLLAPWPGWSGFSSITALLAGITGYCRVPGFWVAPR
jgi:multiple sugar transport system permease protein